MSNLAYYVLGDGGRVDSDHHYEESNDCGVLALVHLTELSYNEAWELAHKAGRRVGQGVHILELLRKTGIQISQGRCLYHQRMTLIAFAEAHPTGNYFVRCKGHVLACKDGFLYDTSSHAATMLVLEYWEVPDPLTTPKEGHRG
jgi:hypothetical protein